MKKRSKKKAYRPGLPVVRADAAGIDLGSREHWVCCPQREAEQANVRQFATTTVQLKALADWLQQEGVQTVAMESTGLYWVALYDLLEERGLEVLLVDARQLKRVPGRCKTDNRDCQWIQKLHSCGLLRGCFRPTGPTLELRTIVRERSNLKEEMGRVLQRMQKALDSMNVKIHHAVTDLAGVTGMSILRAIVQGERDPAVLAQLRDRRCKKSVQQIAQHLEGTWMPEHLFTLERQLEQYEFLQQQLDQYQQHIVHRLHELTPAEREKQAGTGSSQSPKGKGPDPSCRTALAHGAVALQRDRPDAHPGSQCGSGIDRDDRGRFEHPLLPQQQAFGFLAAHLQALAGLGPQEKQEERPRSRFQPNRKIPAYGGFVAKALTDLSGGSSFEGSLPAKNTASPSRPPPESWLSTSIELFAMDNSTWNREWPPTKQNTRKTASSMR